MADLKISQLPNAAVPLEDGDYIPVVQNTDTDGPSTNKVRVSELKQAILNGSDVIVKGPNPTLTSTGSVKILATNTDGSLILGPALASLVTADNIIFVNYRNPDVNQINLASDGLSGSVSSNFRSKTGIFDNIGFYRFNLVNNFYFFQSAGGAIEPKVYFKVSLYSDNSLFCDSHTGANPVSSIDILKYEYVTTAAPYGNNIYLNDVLLLSTSMQANTPLLSQWSKIFINKINKIDGVTTEQPVEYYLRDLANTRTFGASEANLNFRFSVERVYDDATNTDGLNKLRLIRVNNIGAFLEKIR